MEASHAPFSSLLILAALALPAPALAAAQCVAVDTPKAAIEAKGGRWILLTRDQYQFARGIFALNPITRPGVPFGDTGILATLPGRTGGIIFWIDEGKLACEPMVVPQVLVDMLIDEGTNLQSHEGVGL